MNQEQRSLEALRSEILEEGAAFSFPQLVRLLRGRLRAASGDTAPTPRIRPALSLELPRSEVAEVRHDGDRYEIITTFLGLYGVSSPLPAFYTEELIEAAQEDRTAAQALLDAIHQHLYELYVDALDKLRPLQVSVEQNDERFPDLLRSLIGLRDPAMREALPQADALLRYVSLLGAQQRSAEGLRTLLEDMLGGVPVAVEQCVERAVRIPERSRVRLGEQCHALGTNAVIGTHVRDRMGKIRVRIGPLSHERFDTLLNRHDQWHWLVRIIRFYLTTPVECELQLELEPGTGRTTTLGERRSATLGTTTWLFSGTADALKATLQLG